MAQYTKVPQSLLTRLEDDQVARIDASLAGGWRLEVNGEVFAARSKNDAMKFVAAELGADIEWYALDEEGYPEHLVGVKG